MKLDASKFGLAAGAAFAVVWSICTLLVLFWPSSMMALTESMVHETVKNFV